MNIVLIEPYFTGSHKNWAVGLQKHSSHSIELLTLPGSFWKWRMHGGAVTLARMFMESGLSPDLILATDMLDVSTFLSLTRTNTGNIPIALYNFPLCTVPEKYRGYAHASISDWKKKYLDFCTDCVTKLECCGVFEWHTEKRGFANLTPVLQ